MATTRTRQQVLEDIAEIERMERGSITPAETRTGNQFYTHSVWENGKSTSRHVSKTGLAELQKLVAEHKKFKALVQEYEEVVVQQTRRQYDAKYRKKA